MDLREALRNGMRVVGPDDRDYGAIERYDDSAVYVQGRRVPFAAINGLDQDRIHLETPELWQLPATNASNKASSTGIDGGEVRVPVLEERARFGARVVDAGEILIHKSVDEIEEVHRGPLNREDVEIERIRVDRQVAAPEERRQEGDWLIIPIMEEVFVVEKRLMVTEEIRIRKQLVTEEREVRDTIRRERATIEDTRPAPPPPAPRQEAVQGASRDAGDNADWAALHDQVRQSDR